MPDQHGPDVPEPYRCPICRGDENRYMTCEYPGCLDGRDYDHPHALRYRYELPEMAPHYGGEQGFWRGYFAPTLGWIIAAGLILVLIFHR